MPDPKKNNLWLTGIGGFTALLFGFLAYFNYRVWLFRQESYYVVGMIVFGGIAAFSLYAVIAGWRRKLPGQQPAGDPDEPYGIEGDDG